MNEMKISFEGFITGDKGYCDLTEEMDSYLLGNVDAVGDRYRTYVMSCGDRQDGKEGKAFALRLPGATRGYFFTNDEGVIDTLGFYEDSCYVKLPTYSREMEGIKEKYLGRKVIINQDGGKL